MDRTQSVLIENLKSLPGHEDPHHAKRAELRTALRAKAPLDLRRPDGELLNVSAMDVSDSGVGFLCRTELDVNETVGLRLAYHHESEFEDFQIRRGTSTIGGYKVGAVIQ